MEFGGSSNDLLFSTKERDASIGLDCFGFRYYDSVLGKFTSLDPVKDGHNWYLYVGNNPINRVDALDLRWKWVDKAIAAGDSALFASAAYGRQTQEVFKGYGDAAVGVVTGVKEMVVHPINTAKGIAKAVIHPVDTANAIIDDIKEKSGSLRGQGTLIGDIAIAVISGGTGKALQETSRLAKIAKALDKATPDALKKVDAPDIKKLDVPDIKKVDTSTVTKVEKVKVDTPDAKANGRAGKQKRLSELADDPKLGKADRGWLKQEKNAIERGSTNAAGNKKKHIRNPPGKDLAHQRGREAAKGYDYKHSDLKTKADHQLQHKHDKNGKLNKERPVKKDE